ncbi:hypothetical protein [Pulveribacter sp.]|uniref:hypothetical protein n=1 Tax=Pulveribacter sp. TaxID=2678893 RepID=UPI0028AF0C96|nr:hypothetical protein [Pulveribacter sp.]
MHNQLDAKDQALLAGAVAARDLQPGPRIGDYVLFATGQLERFSHDWDDALQTSPGGSFYLSSLGEGSLSCGALNPPTPKSRLQLSEASLPGAFWFFHHGLAGAGRGMHFEIACRVFKTDAPYTGFLSKDFQSSRIEELKTHLEAQLA